MKRVCPQCDCEFEIKHKERNKRTFCSHSCAAIFHKAGPNRLAKMHVGGRARAEVLRGTGTKGSYVKRGGRHEHRVVAEQKLGRPLLPGEIVHHEDEDRKNNSPGNLQVLSSQSVHARIHGFGNGRPQRTICKKGLHSLSGDNLKILADGSRVCLTCQRAYQAKWKRDKRRSGK